MNIVISGLTAAGKTTHALLLAAHFGYKYVSASQMLAELAGQKVDSATDSWWLTSGKKISTARADGSIDRTLDERMCQLANEFDRQVFDAWALPWTSDEPMLRIWLESDHRSRARKCFVSHLPSPPTLEECGKHIEEKDRESRHIFKSIHGFDLLGDDEVFDLIVDSSELISDSTREAADVGIATLDPVLTEACRWITNEPGGTERAFQTAAERLPPGAIIRSPIDNVDMNRVDDR